MAREVSDVVKDAGNKMMLDSAAEELAKGRKEDALGYLLAISHVCPDEVEEIISDYSTKLYSLFMERKTEYS